jgi:hypothetical protein
MKYDTDMQRYSEFQPTGFDTMGYMLDEQQDWYVVPVSRTRDSGPLEESNFASAIEMLGGECEDVMEIHRFGHWGPGWFEIIIVNPENENVMKAAMEIEASLAAYPVLDDMDFSEREWDEMFETWEQMGLPERIELCCKTGNSIFAARHDAIPDGIDAYHLGVE